MNARRTTMNVWPWGLGSGVLAIVVLAAATMAVRSGLWCWRGLHPQRVHVSPEARTRAFGEVPDLEDVVFRTSDGLTLRGWFSPGKRRAAVVFVHGGGGNRLQLFPEARVLGKHGYGFLVYDSRANGESDGDLTTLGDREQRDVAAAVGYVAGRSEIDPKRIGLLGHSIGGSTVALESSRDPRVRAVILYATWLSLEDETKTNNSKYGPLSWAPMLLVMRFAGVNIHNVRPIDEMTSIQPRPLLMITGDRDEDTPVPVMRHLFEAAGEPKELWIVPGATHGSYFSTAPEEYESRVSAFLERALRSG